MKFTLTISEATEAEISAFFQRLPTVSEAVNAAVHQQVPTPAMPQPMTTISPPTLPTMPPQPQSDDDGEGDGPQADANSLDAEGYRWDERIHSSPPKRTGKNVWRKKRGVNESLITAVQNEQRAAIQQPQYQQPPMMPVQQPQYQQPPMMPVQQPQYQQPPMMPVQQPQPQYQQPPMMPVQQPQPVTVAIDFNGFMMHIQQLLQAGRIDASYLGTVATRIGIQTITDLSGDEQRISQAVNVMAADGRW